MPAASWRTRPARSMSLWLSASASAGSSRRVGTSDFDSRMLLCVFRLVRALDAGGVDEPRDRRAAQDVRLHDLRKVFLLHAGVPDVLRIEHHHRAVAALGEAARFVDADVSLAPGLRNLGAELLHEAFDVPLRRAVVAARAHEDVRFVLAHQLAAPAVFAA